MSNAFQGRQAYIELAEEIFRELGLPPPAMTHDVNLPLATILEVKGVPFAVIHASDIAPTRLLVECTFGPPPAEHRIEVLSTLLRANQSLLQAGQGTFGYDAETGTILYLFAQPLEEMRATSLLEKMAQVAQYAHQWLATFFLEDTAPFDLLDPIEINAEEIELYRHQFANLADEICLQLQIAPTTDIEEDQQRITRRFHLDETIFSLSHATHAAPLFTLSYHGGQVREDCVEDALCALLQFDHKLAYSEDPVFCIDAASGNAVFACCSTLKDKTTPHMIAKMADMIEQASRLCNGEETASASVQIAPASFRIPPTAFA
jgi:hypothetical protein